MLKPLIDKVTSEVLLVISVSTIKKSVDVFFSAYVKESVNCRKPCKSKDH